MKGTNNMKNKHYIFLAAVFTLVSASIGSDAILTAKENAFTACVHANRAASIEEIKIICGE
jgi:hypothetical protein